MPALSELSPLAWSLLAVSAVFVGLSKSAVPGVNTISIALFAAVLPARASTGALLLLLIVGDVFALLAYRRYADWRTLVSLAPAVAVGIALGALFLAFADDGGVRKTIGAILVLVIAFTLWRRHVSQRTTTGSVAAGSSARAATGLSIGYGTLGGFTTMVANAGGPVMSMYFLARRFEVLSFLGTAAWFFAVINLAKVPIAVGLGVISWQTVQLVLLLAPGVVFGALVGRRIARRIDQRVFDWLVVIGTLLGAAYLLLS